eukprot:gnl/TRDRNA2_/TRDRNA2_102365_c2_seq1.p1 gnl/TRDRNA2_/TRDRNA2_102365_c2~~gnl/TRDRNA2_/TRDRNA2_102365_c2_seq1.p1  ORF type:complete len:121 (+),score=9.29 gnl/TRDRNA2_/TRDRNA2_102365_c2_seq1:3-365(+)
MVGLACRDPAQAVLLARFLQRNRLESCKLDETVLQELERIRTVKDFQRSDLFVHSCKKVFDECFKKCKSSAKNEPPARRVAASSRRTLAHVVHSRHSTASLSSHILHTRVHWPPFRCSKT